MKIALYPNFLKPNALECAVKTCDILNELGAEVYAGETFRESFSEKPYVKYEDIRESAKSADFVIAIGGDGTILRCARRLMGTDTKLLGINTGTLGFMAGLEADRLDRLESLFTGDYEISERMTLDAVYTADGCEEVYTALNEVSVRSGSFRIADFDICSDGFLVGKYRADGVLFSTPSGSTAYALSAGGPVIEPDLECIEMTQICPHSLFSRTTLFSAERKLKITCRTAENEYMTASIDGWKQIKLCRNDSLEVHRGKYKIKFVNPIKNSFHDSICKKLCKPLK